MTAVLLLTLVALTPEAGNDSAVRAAIQRAAVERLGPGADVSVRELQINATVANGPIAAVPEPAARVGRPSVFSLTARTPAGPRRIGSAVATIDASAPHLRLRRDVRRGEELTIVDVDEIRGPIADAPLKPLPRLQSVVGARATRDLASGVILTASVVIAIPMIKAGQQVSVRARVGNIEARTLGIATQSGETGDLVRVVLRDSKKTLIGRVVASGEVEVVHGS
jgi:flagella basal body P-ring formation protein FlgA